MVSLRLRPRLRTLLCCLLFSCCFQALAASASDEPFTGPANWGGTGLMEIPTARVMREDTYRVGASQVYPYRYYYVAFSPLPRIEVDGRITEVMGVRAFPNVQNSSYGNDKDKALDLKLQLLSETKYLPAFSLGIMDPQGTRIYSSQYLVASKQIYPFDFTIGLGNGRFGKTPLPPSGEAFKAEIFSNPQAMAQRLAGILGYPVRSVSQIRVDDGIQPNQI